MSNKVFTKIKVIATVTTTDESGKKLATKVEADIKPGQLSPTVRDNLLALAFPEIEMVEEGYGWGV